MTEVREQNVLAKKFINQYLKYLLSLPSNEYPSITKTYFISPICKSNNYIKRFQVSLNALDLEDRKLIIKRFLEEETTDSDIYQELSLSERTYYRKKSQALTNLILQIYYSEG